MGERIEREAAELWDQTLKRLSTNEVVEIDQRDLKQYKKVFEEINGNSRFGSDWISPFDCSYILSKIENLHLRHAMIVDETGGNLALEFVQFLDLIKTPIHVKIVAKNLTSENYRLLASNDYVISIYGDDSFTNYINEVDVVIARFNTSFNKFETVGKCLKSLMIDRSVRHLFLHEYYPELTYPFQYYREASIPNVLDVFDLLIKAGRVEFVGDSWTGLRTLDLEMQQVLLGNCKSTLVGHFKII